MTENDPTLPIVSRLTGKMWTKWRFIGDRQGSAISGRANSPQTQEWMGSVAAEPGVYELWVEPSGSLDTLGQDFAVKYVGEAHDDTVRRCLHRHAIPHLRDKLFTDVTEVYARGAALWARYILTDPLVGVAVEEKLRLELGVGSTGRYPWNKP
jgi:hypothetical protein